MFIRKTFGSKMNEMKMLYKVDLPGSFDVLAFSINITMTGFGCFVSAIA